VQIVGSGSTIQLSSGSASVNSVVSSLALNIAGGSLTSSTVQVNGSLTVGASGAINNAQILPGTGGSVSISGGTLASVVLNAGATVSSGTLDNVTLGASLSSTGSFTIRNGLNLNGQTWTHSPTITGSIVTFNRTQTIAGPGTIELRGLRSNMAVTGGTSTMPVQVTIASGVTVNVATGGYSFSVPTAFERWVNAGTIISSLPTSPELVLSSFDNQGTIRSTNGTVLMRSGWTNSGTFEVNGGTLTLGGLIGPTTVGTFVRNGGTVNISGTWTGDLPLNVLGTVNLLSGGVLKDGTYLPSGGSVLTLAGGTLDNFTLGGDLTSTVSFTIRNGLNLNGRTWTHSPTTATTVTFSGTQTIAGPGSVELVIPTSVTANMAVAGGTSSMPAQVTIASGVTVNARGAGVCRFSVPTSLERWVNAGTMTSVASSSTGILDISSLDNQGTIRSTNGTVLMRSGWTNSGTFDVNGGTLTLGGLIGPTTVGTFVRNGGTVNISGTWTGDLPLNVLGSVNLLSGGVLKNGTCLSSGAVLTLAGGTLDNFTLGADVNASASFVVRNGLNLNGRTLTLLALPTGSTASVLVEASQSITGPGTIITNGNWSLLVQGGTSTGPVQITSGVTVRGSGTFSFTGSSTLGRIVSSASVFVENPTAVFSMSLVDILGPIVVTAGTLNLSSSITTSPSTINMSNGAINLSGTVTPASFGLFTRTGGSVGIAGTWTGDLSLDATLGSVTLVAGGILRNGTYQPSGGAALTVSGGTLDNFTLGANLTATGGFEVKNELRLNGRTLTVDLSSSSTISFTGVPSITGPGTILVNGSTATFREATNSLSIGATIGLGVTIRGSGSAAFSPGGKGWISAGTIISETASKTWTMSGFVNQGTIRSIAGTVSIGGIWNNSGTIDITGGTLTLGDISTPGTNTGAINFISGTLNLGGNSTSSAFDRIFRPDPSAGTFNITGTWTGDLTLNPARGSVNLVTNGVLKNSTYTTNGGPVLNLAGGTLDNVTLGSDLTTFDAFSVRNGLKLNGRTWTHSPPASTTKAVTFVGTQSITGPGTVLLNGAGTSNMLVSFGQEWSPVPVTIASDVVVRVMGNVVFNNVTGFRTSDLWVNRGSIILEKAGTTTGLGNFDNYGLIHAMLGDIGVLSYQYIFHQYAGELRIESGRTFTHTVLTINGGLVTGLGTIDADVKNAGTVAPGLGTTNGNLSIVGYYTQLANGNLVMDWGPTGVDRLNVTRGATLAGNLVVNVSGFVPTNGSANIAVNGVPQSGTFSTVIDGNVNDPVTWSVGYSPTSATVTATSPTLSVGGPYTVAEGDSLTLNALLSSDVNLSQPFTYSWDLDGDGQFDDAQGRSPTLTWEDLVALGLANGPATTSIRVQVIDNNGFSFTGAATLTINNAPPQVSWNVPVNVPFGTSVSLALSANDPSPADQAASFTYDIDWDGNGIFDQTVVMNSGTVTYLYPDVGAYAIKFRVTDRDGGVSLIGSATVNIFGYMLRSNPNNPLTTDLIWSGTSGADSVQFEQTAADQITLRTLLLNNAAVNTQQTIDGVTGRVVGWGQKGADQLDASFVSGLPTELRGGGGADTILGGAAENILYGDSDGGDGGGSDSIVGGASADTIYADGPEGNSDTIDGGNGNDTIFSDPIQGGEGGADLVQGGNGQDLISTGPGNDTIDGGVGNDVVFGGSGNDSITGGAGEDLLVSGNLAANFFSNQQAGIKQLAEQWQTSDSFATRVNYLQGSPGGIISPAFVLTPGTAVLNDDIVDQVIADDDADADWLIINLDDLAQSTVVDQWTTF
jgi:hypothetical protein